MSELTSEQFEAERAKLADPDNPDCSTVTMEQAAEYLELSVRQTRHLCKLGHLGEKPGPRHWVITKDELIKFKANGRPKVGRPKEA